MCPSLSLVQTVCYDCGSFIGGQTNKYDFRIIEGWQVRFDRSLPNVVLDYPTICFLKLSSLEICGCSCGGDSLLVAWRMVVPSVSTVFRLAALPLCRFAVLASRSLFLRVLLPPFAALATAPFRKFGFLLIGLKQLIVNKWVHCCP